MTPRPRLALVALLVLVSACSRDPRRAAPSSSAAPPPPPVSASSSAELPPPAPIGIDPGDDASPAAPSTAKESLAAKPMWRDDDDNYAPELWESERRDLFEAAGKAKRPVVVGEDLLLVCRAGYHSATDPTLLFGPPELDLSLTIGGDGPLVVHGPEDTYSAHVMAPLFRLRGRELVAVHMRDRDDIGGDEELALVRGALHGKLPLVVRRGAASLECRGFGRKEVEEQLARRLKSADERLAILAKNLWPREDKEDLGLAEAFAAARGRILELAAFVGWADPRIGRRLAWERRLQMRFIELAAPVAAKLLSRAEKQGRWEEGVSSSLSASVEGIECGPEVAKRYQKADKRFGRGALARWGCILRVAIENRGPSELMVNLIWGALTLQTRFGLVLADGTPIRTRLIELEDAKRETVPPSVRRLARGARGRAIFVALGELTPTHPARSPRMVIVRPPTMDPPLVLAIPGAG